MVALQCSPLPSEWCWWFNTLLLGGLFPGLEHSDPLLITIFPERDSGGFGSPGIAGEQDGQLCCLEETCSTFAAGHGSGSCMCPVFLPI